MPCVLQKTIFKRPLLKDLVLKNTYFHLCCFYIYNFFVFLLFCSELAYYCRGMFRMEMELKS